MKESRERLSSKLPSCVNISFHCQPFPPFNINKQYLQFIWWEILIIIRVSNVGLKGSHFSVLLLLSQTTNWAHPQKNFFQILFFATFHLLALRRNFHQQHVQTSAIACWRNQNMTKIDLFELFLSNQDRWLRVLTFWSTCWYFRAGPSAPCDDILLWTTTCWQNKFYPFH